MECPSEYGGECQLGWVCHRSEGRRVHAQRLPPENGLCSPSLPEGPIAPDTKGAGADGPALKHQTALKVSDHTVTLPRVVRNEGVQTAKTRGTAHSHRRLPPIEPTGDQKGRL